MTNAKLHEFEPSSIIAHLIMVHISVVNGSMVEDKKPRGSGTIECLELLDCPSVLVGADL